MGGVRDGDDRRVELGALEHLGRIGEDRAADAEALRGARAVARSGIGDRRDDGVRVRVRAPAGARGSPTSRSR